MKRREVLKAALGAGLGLAAPALLAQNRPVRITLPSPGSAGAVWKPIIAKLGLNDNASLPIEWVVADPGKMQTQLTAGALDIGVFGAVGLSALAAKGSDIVLFGPALNNHGRWLVRADSPYRTPADLVGKRIATTAETSETYQQALIAAHLTGLNLKRDFQVIHGSPTANLALFDRGDVDAIITLEPTASRLIARGSREIARVADIWKKATRLPGAPFLVGLAANRRWIEQNPDLARRTAALFIRTNSAIHADPALLTSVASEIGLKGEEARAAALLPERLTDSYATAWDDSVFAVIDRQIEVAAELGLVPGKLNRKIYTKV